MSQRAPRMNEAATDLASELCRVRAAFALSAQQPDPDGAARTAPLCQDLSALLAYAQEACLTALRLYGCARPQVALISRSGLIVTVPLGPLLDTPCLDPEALAAGLAGVLTAAAIDAYAFWGETLVVDAAQEDAAHERAVFVRVAHPSDGEIVLLAPEHKGNTVTGLRTLYRQSGDSLAHAASSPLMTDLYALGKRLRDEVRRLH